MTVPYAARVQLYPPEDEHLRFETCTKKTLRDSLPIDMLLSAVSFLVVAQSSSEVPEGLMNNPVYHAKPILLFFFLKLISLLQILWGFLKNIWVHIVRTQN